MLKFMKSTCQKTKIVQIKSIMFRLRTIYKMDVKNTNKMKNIIEFLLGSKN